MYLDGEVTHTYLFAAQVHDSTIAIFRFFKNKDFFSYLRNLLKRNLAISVILKGGVERPETMLLYCLIKKIV